MSGNKLSGMRRVDEVYFHKDVDHEAGVYIFYRTQNGPPRYVGRADTSLYRRIRGRDYLYYKYKHCKTEVAAYRWECKYWHRYQNSIENSYNNSGNHPAKPVGKNVTCPECD